MKRTLLTLSSIAIFLSHAVAQVKVGDNPASIDPSAALEVESTNKGVLIPRMTSAQRQAIASPATGLQVFDTNANALYYYNGTNWVEVSPNNAATNLFNSNGTIPSSTTRTIALDGGSNLNIDNNTLYISGDNNRIGIGTASPTQTLDVDGTARFDGGLTLNEFFGGSWIDLPTTGPSGIGSGGTGQNAWIAYVNNAGNYFNNAQVGDVVYRNNTGKLLWGNSPGNAAMAMHNDNLGIGTITPSERLDLEGNLKFSGAIMPGGSAGTAGQVLVSNGAGNAPIWSAPTVGDNLFNANGTIPASTTRRIDLAAGSQLDIDTGAFFIDGNLGRVGIGTNGPGERLELIGNFLLNGAFMPGGSAGTAGQVLVSNGAGNAPIWSASTAGDNLFNANGTIPASTTRRINLAAGSQLDIDTGALFIDGNLRRVGIGTNGPGYTLDVNGTARFHGGAQLNSFSGGSWLDMPTTGPSGIGNGGPGANAWVAYAQSNGNYFNNALTGDIVYRNTGGRLLWGNSSGDAIMVLNSNRLGLGTSTPDQSALVEMASTTQGFLPPRMTNAQRDAISNPAQGLVIFNTNTLNIQWFDGIGWYDAATGPTYEREPCNPFRQVAVVDVVSPSTGKTWMDRNLGANRVAVSVTDAEAYGDLFQWGRDADGHHCVNRFPADGITNSATTTTKSNTDSPGHGDFIITSSGFDDWLVTPNNDLWSGVNGSNNPCPVGYRLPTEGEFFAEKQSWSSSNSAGAFGSPLKLTNAGVRINDGTIPPYYYVDYYGYYWTSSWLTGSARALIFESSSADFYTQSRGDAHSVRCIKD